MIRKTILLTLLIIPFFFISCSSSRFSRTTDSSQSQVSTPLTGNPARDYINMYRDIAVSEMKRTGVPASITLAQGMIESNYGKSELARRANNHFGIKCHNWKGPVVYHDDDRKNECFRKYSDPDESFRDHSEFLRTGSRYSFLFDLPADDYKSWARGLKKAGYATNPDYANMLIRKIEEQNLAIYDKGYVPAWQQPTARNEQAVPKPVSNSQDGASVAANTIVAKPLRIQVNNRIEYIIVRDGDTRKQLEEEFKLLRWELPRYNDLPEDFELIPGQILYLQPKRDKAEPGNDNYTFREGDSMLIVAQKFGIKLKSLYEMNRLDPGTEPAPGTKLWLRSMKPVF